MASKYDWERYGDEIVDLYLSGLSVRELIPIVEPRHGVKYPSGTLTNYLGRRGVLRSKVEAHRLAISKAVRVCELCGTEHNPRNYNQRWCDSCTGVDARHKKRVRNHGLPARLFDDMFTAQEHRCKICGREFESCVNTRKKKTLFVDHDHVTNQVRGLLCPRCNCGMSYVDDESWLSRAQQYVSSARSQDEKVFVRPPRMKRYVRNKPVNVKALELANAAGIKLP